MPADKPGLEAVHRSMRQDTPPELGGYSAVARALTERFGLDPPLDRRRVLNWDVRRTANAAGQAFPEPVERIPGTARSAGASVRIRIPDVIAWAARGWPRPHADGYETPAEYNERYAQARTRVDNDPARA